MGSSAGFPLVCVLGKLWFPQSPHPCSPSEPGWTGDACSLQLVGPGQGRPGLHRWEAAPWGPLPDPSLSVVFPAQLFPGRPPVRKLLETLQEWLASLPLDRIPYDAVLDLVNNKMRVRQPLRRAWGTLHLPSADAPPVSLPGSARFLRQPPAPSAWVWDRRPTETMGLLSGSEALGFVFCFFSELI